MNSENKDQQQISLDILKYVEDLSNKMNEVVGSRTKSAFRKYPLTFALLVLIGVVAVSEGMKGILESVSWFDNHPWELLLAGLVILIFTGTLYKKLDKDYN